MYVKYICHDHEFCLFFIAWKQVYKFLIRTPSTKKQLLWQYCSECTWTDKFWGVLCKKMRVLLWLWIVDLLKWEVILKLSICWFHKDLKVAIVGLKGQTALWSYVVILHLPILYLLLPDKNSHIVFIAVFPLYQIIIFFYIC